MVDTILVLNAGSSRLKFSLFLAEDKTLPLALGGQLGTLLTDLLMNLKGKQPYGHPNAPSCPQG